MIKLIMRGEDYEQDIRPLIKAFYPEEEFEIDAAREAALPADEGGTYSVALFLRLNPADYAVTVKANGKTLSEEEDFSSPEEGTYAGWMPLRIPDSGTEAASALSGAADSGTEEALALSGMVDSGREAPSALSGMADSGTETAMLRSVPDRRMYRNHLARSLYRMLSELTGRELPWGILTGIRPTKQALERLIAGEAETPIADYFSREYLCSDEKVRLCIQVAKKERELLSGITEDDSYSLYIGVPFCPSICLYCSFSSYPIAQYKKYVEPYLEALEKEIKFAAGCFPEKKLISIYVGGGTPTTLSAEQLAWMIQQVKQNFDLSYLREWSVEAGRPDSITKEKLQALKREGITRISINPQTMQQRTLDIIGRRHTAEQIVEAFLLARECGFDNINMDLIIGLTGEGKADIEATLAALSPLSPDSLTVHTLAVKRAARLNAEKERYADKRSTEARAMLAVCEQYMKEHGYEPYYLYRQKNMADNLENVGYARAGKEGLYNVLIMEEKHTILAIGANAATKMVYPGGRVERCENVKDVTQYIGRIDEMIERKRVFFGKDGR